MNYYAHGHRFISDPYFLAGTAVPDWLGVLDRRARARGARTEPLLGHEDPRAARLAAGILQHLEDDRWCHATQAFAETSLAMCILFRDALPADQGFRPHLLGHIGLELLLDSALIARQPSRLEEYYASIDQLDTDLVRSIV